MEDRDFSLERANAGITAIHKAFADLKLTIPEAYWAVRCYQVAAAEVLGEKVSSLLDSDLGF